MVPTLLCVVVVQACGVPWVLSPIILDAGSYWIGVEYSILVWLVWVGSGPDTCLVSSLLLTVCFSQRFLKYVFNSVAINYKSLISKSARER